MVYLRIAAFKQSLNRNGGKRIRTAPVLLLPEQEFQQILTRGGGDAQLSYLLHYAPVSRLIIFVLPFKPVALVKGFGHFTGKLYIYKGRAAAALADDGVYYLHALRDGAADNGACDRLKICFRQVEITRPFITAVRLEIIAGRGARLVIFHALLKPGDECVAGFDGDVTEAGKAADSQRGLKLLVREFCRLEIFADGFFCMVTG